MGGRARTRVKGVICNDIVTPQVCPKVESSRCSMAENILLAARRAENAELGDLSRHCNTVYSYTEYTKSNNRLALNTANSRFKVPYSQRKLGVVILSEVILWQRK